MIRHPDGRIAGSGITEDRYDEESYPDITKKHSGCTLPHEDRKWWSKLSSPVTVYQIAVTQEKE